ncbi:hypothetical protein SDC9_154020 [bioreactor metagenome]|uniref:Uncharacterized protein n=1 Tax=bioreactor metagenome TaxID=1076179 RepID=A0A645F274_9ZZZZ
MAGRRPDLVVKRDRAGKHPERPPPADPLPFRRIAGQFRRDALRAIRHRKPRTVLHRGPGIEAVEPESMGVAGAVDQQRTVPDRALAGTEFGIVVIGTAGIIQKGNPGKEGDQCVFAPVIMRKLPGEIGNVKCGVAIVRHSDGQSAQRQQPGCRSCRQSVAQRFKQRIGTQRIGVVDGQRQAVGTPVKRQRTGGLLHPFPGRFAGSVPQLSGHRQIISSVPEHERMIRR